MAITITTTNLEEIKKIAEDLLNQAEETEDVRKKAEIEADLDTAISAYKSTSKAQVYNAAKESGNPMHYAVNAFFYPTIRVKEEKTETGGVIRKIDDALTGIDLGDLHKNLGGIGADKKWIYLAEKLNFYLTYRAAKDVGHDALMKLLDNTDCFTMDKISHEVDLGKNPVSNTNMLKTLQTVITAMLGDGYRASSYDVKYLDRVYVNDDKRSKTSVRAANHKALRNYLKKVCWQILNGRPGYDVDQREIRTK